MDGQLKKTKVDILTSQSSAVTDKYKIGNTKPTHNYDVRVYP
jgi:hypothetical protein